MDKKKEAAKVEKGASGERTTSKAHMLSSGMSGFIAYSATHPLERVKLMRQTSQPGYTDSMGIG